ncbi:MAG: chemotaxis-specific protein-glutamate methyltransferase CheB [Deltaproteobacteria bacterium]|nr:chemotaxis-specific protein-glutamate methyltransferase CheB [Deltaproteobacteria bacterium]
MSRARPRVLVVDDSAFARTVLSRVLRSSGEIDVVGIARDGVDALERIAILDPDIVTLDLAMPGLDGLGVLQALAGRSRPRVIVVSISAVDSELGAEALSLGAIDLVSKPTALASDRLNEIGGDLIARILAVRSGSDDVVEAPSPTMQRDRRAELIMLGTSTGGPQALTRLVAALPADLKAPLVMVLHIPAGYTHALAERLNRSSALHVVEAEDGLELAPGLAVLARGGSHLRVEARGAGLYCVVSALPIVLFTPSVDELFLSGAAAVGKRTLGVVLTGMGDDGLIGSRAIAAAGGVLLTEAAASCVVYGMPRCVQEAGIGAVSIHLDDMAKGILDNV